MSTGHRPFLPAALLIVGVTLSCSTACITSSVILDAQAKAQRREEEEAAWRQLVQNVQNRGGDFPLAVVPDDPAAIRHAFQLALPAKDPGFSSPDATPGSVEVTTEKDPTGQTVYLIHVQWSDFRPFYHTAFLKYADAVHRAMAKPTVFRVSLFRVTPGVSYPMATQEFR